LSDAVGLDHDEDIIWVWLNPVIHFIVNSDTSFQWDGFGFDLNDPIGDTDVVGVPVKFLNGHAPMPTELASLLARRWAPRITCTAATDPTCGPDGTDDPGLTAGDLAAILEADPFSDPSYVVNVPAGHTCTADGRFCRTTNQNLQYSPPPPGGQPTTQTFSIVKQTTATEGQSVKDTRKVGFSTDFTAKGGFLAKWTAKLSTADTLTWTNQWSSLSTQQVGQTSEVSVTGPVASANYTGPVEFNVFQDNVYGSFMFGFVPAPTFNLFASPASQNVNQGSCTNYTVSVSALVSGFNSSVTLNVAGLPTNATATFNPNPIVGAGSSALTVCTASSTPIGSSTLTINGVSGIEIHSASVTLTTNTPPPPPDFTLTVTPSSQSISPGGSTSYSLSTTAVSGFAGSIALSVTGLPSGASASFSPASITGAGSSTLFLATTSSVSPGTFSLTITGTSGSLSHSSAASLVVTSPPPPPPPGGCSIVKPSSTTVKPGLIRPPTC
jgi:hypothetical protein